MSTTADAKPAASATGAPSLASSDAFRIFAVVFAIAAPIIYTICEMRNWPLFTYHPGTNRLDLFWAAAVRGEGPAMHWYGWTVNTVIGSVILGFIATYLPGRLTRRIPLALTWIAALAVVPVLIYGLKFYWRW